MPEELIETLFQAENVRIERIVSTGQSSTENFWYDQPETEWVILLQGEAVLQFQGKKIDSTLKARRLCAHSASPNASRFFHFGEADDSLVGGFRQPVETAMEDSSGDTG
ncbi:MAG: hypothetical protein ACRC2T_04955 [Thermoguttaceae bacterium]